jgi:hypothetical protein
MFLKAVLSMGPTRTYVRRFPRSCAWKNQSEKLVKTFLSSVRSGNGAETVHACSGTEGRAKLQTNEEQVGTCSLCSEIVVSNLTNITCATEEIGWP